MIELLTGLLSILTVWKLGISPQGIGALLLLYCLITLSFIDLDHYLLPDTIVLPLLWAGLLLNTQNVFTSPISAILGASFAYLSLWCFYHAFRIVTGKHGMGFGDFKLFAVFGAWFGWQFLPQILLISSLVGAVAGLLLLQLKKHDEGKPIPFGPYLAIAGMIAVLWGDEINQTYLHLSGLG